MKKIYKVVCINNKPIRGGSEKKQSLTEGKIYETTDNPDYRDVCVINDRSIEVNYSSSRFITLEEWRERKLIELFQ